MTAPAGADELSRTLRTLRGELDVSGAEIARRCGWSESKVNRFLHGKIAPKPAQVRAMLDAMQVDPAKDRRYGRALELAELYPAGHANRQHILRSGTIVAQRRYAEIENSSEHVQTFTRGIVPGLLQSPRYVRAVFSSEGSLSPDVVEEAVAHRAERQQTMLASTARRRYTQVMSEGALRWNAGCDAMIEQLDVIAELARIAPPTVRIGIIPWWQVVDVFPMVEINLYDERAVIINTGDGVTHITNARAVDVYVSDFRHLRDLAVWGEEAAHEAERIASDYRALRASR